MDSDWSTMVTVGRIARAHGRRGEVIVDAQTDFVEARFGVGAEVHVLRPGGPSRLRITSMRLQKGRPVVGLEGVESMDDAEALAGDELRIPASARPPLPEGSYYTSALVGCEVRTGTGRTVGTVVDVQEAGGTSRLLVRSAGAEDEIDIPLVDPICVDVDTTARRVVIEPPDGLLELNQRP